MSAKSENLGIMTSILKGASINLFGTASHLVIAFGYSIFLARVLAPEDLGRYFLGFTILNFLVIVAVLGFDFAIWRYVSIFMGEGSPERARGVVISSLSVTMPASFILGIAMFAAGDWAGELFFHDPGMGIVFRMFALSLPVMVMARILNASTQGLCRMKYQVISKDLGEQVARFAASIVLLSFGLTGILTANIAAGMISACLAFWFLHINLPLFGKGNRRESQFRLVTTFSLPLIFSTIFSYLLLWVDTLMLGYFNGSSDVGLYSIATRVAILGTLVLTAFNTMFSPLISDMYHRSELERLGLLFKFVTKWVVTVSLPIFLLVILFAQPVLTIFGERFIVVSSSLIILAIGQFVNSATGPVAGMVLMSGRPWLDLMNNLGAMAMNIILCLILIPVFGILGAAVANAAAVGIINLIRAVEVYVTMKVQGYDRTYIKPAVAALVAGILVYSMYLVMGSGRGWIFMPLALMLVGIYGGVLLMLGFGEDDRAMARMIKERLSPSRS